MSFDPEYQLRRNSVRVVDHLERLRLNSGHDIGTWAQFMGLQAHDYVEIARGFRAPQLAQITILSELLGFNLDSVLHCEMDERTLASIARESGDKNMDEIYAQAAFSRRRTSINVLAYLEDIYGWRTKLSVLRRFGLNEAAFMDPEKRISLRFLMDLVKTLHEMGLSERSLFETGAFSAITNQNSPISRRIGASRSVLEAYERLVYDCTRMMEENFTYSIEKLGEDFLVVGAKQNPDAAEALKMRRMGNREVCMNKCGVVASAPIYMGLAVPEVRETHCVHHGDPFCQYEVSLKTHPRSLNKAS